MVEEVYVEQQPMVTQIIQQPPQQIYVQSPPQVIREREIVEVPVEREVIRHVGVPVNVPQFFDRVVETPPQFIETIRHTRDPSVRIRLELCAKCRKNPINQRALQEIRLLSGAPPTQFHTTTQTLNPTPVAPGFAAPVQYSSAF
jgi:hypothetical protein